MHKFAAVVGAGILSASLPMGVAAAQSIYLSGTQQGGTYHPTAQSEADYFTGVPGAAIVQYPHALVPGVIGETWLGPSVQAGVDAGLPMVKSGDTVVCVSQGCVVAEQIKAKLDPSVTGVTFISFANPSSDHGIMSTLHGLGVSVPGILPTTVADDDTRFNTVNVSQEYDGIADAPDDPMNVLADLNAVAGAYYLHPHYSVSMADPTGPDRTVTTVTNSHDATTTSILIHTAQLPITQPLRQLGVPTQVVDGIDKVLRPAINAGYHRAAAKKAGVKAHKAHTGKKSSK